MVLSNSSSWWVLIFVLFISCARLSNAYPDGCVTNENKFVEFTKDYVRLRNFKKISFLTYSQGKFIINTKKKKHVY